MSRLIEQFLERFSQPPAVAQVLERSARGGNNIVVSNLRGGSGAALASCIEKASHRPLVVLASTLERAEALVDGLCFFGQNALLFPGLETLPFETAEPALHISAARSKALAEFAELKPGQPAPIFVAPLDAMMIRCLPREELRGLSLSIEWGASYDLDELAHRLVTLGYRREVMVESPGEFSIRGTIVDVYPADADTPWRLDFFGEEIESIRTFDTSTQRSIPLNREIERIRILPSSSMAPALEHLGAGGKLVSIFELLPQDALLIVEGPMRIDQRIEYFEEISRRHWNEIQSHGQDQEQNFFVRHELQPSDWVLTTSEARESMRRFQRLEWVDISAEADDAAGPATEAVSIAAQNFETVPANYKNFIDLIEEKRLGGYLVAIVCDNAGQMQRLEELLAERHVGAVIIDSATPGDATNGSQLAEEKFLSSSDVGLMVGDLHEGFIFPAARLLILTDREIFGRYKRRRIYRRAYHGKAVKDPTEIQRGDYVVHGDHGIGRFEGIRRQPIEGRISEFLELLYQDGDKLLVPIEKLFMVQKYASAEGKVPALDKLGKKTWNRKRAKSREAVKKLAGELLELYARREAAERPPYSEDTVWQQEFEASFLYQETPDQLKAIKDTKADMMRHRPMDRLICGDVGYGKTEVAVRAAFKVLVEGRQVAVLVPTTLLAQQHFNTFSERLADYPFKVGVLSRFSSPAEQKATLKELAAGEVRLIVGTHRILSKDIKFQNLGLLVVDEEQRFGVAQKEKIKSLRAAVDILTLTATPIPRTLHLALAKLRDLSIIQTPPADRLPIKTRTIHWDKDMIEEAILRELNRGGQVFFVHNRVESIDDVANSIREIVPQARIAIGHGQMDEGDLEKIMMDFIAGKHDILIATTIIENGIDIPNVNTILINRADAMGLAQLYQLRGRVGRDVRQAYAYLILPRGRAITDTAVKRLSALEEFTELGMGFSIAMRDMEIRGTGNILGSEQHGAITDVGFEMYCKLLEEAVLETRGEQAPEPPYPTEVKWPVDQWLPEVYVPIESQRIRLYKDLSSAQTQDQLQLVYEELLDRYGDLPAEGHNLIHAFRVKIALSPWHVDTVRPGQKGTLRMTCKEYAQRLTEAIAKRAAGRGWVDKIERRHDGNIILHYDEEMDEQPEGVLAELAKMLEHLPEPDLTAVAVPIQS